MASPVATALKTEFASATTAHNVVMPATINAGDLLLLFFAARGSVTFTTPAGWTIIAARAVNGTTEATIVYGKIAVGNEDGTNVDVVTSATALAVGIAVRVTGWNGSSLASDVVAGTGATGTSTGANPPSASWSWGSLDALAFEFSAFPTSSGGGTAPSGYSYLLDGDVGSGSTGLRAYVSTKDLTAQASPEDPPSRTLTASVAWVAQTVVVSGPAGVAHSAAASIAGAGSVAAVGKRGALGASALAGAASISAVGKLGAGGVSSLNGAGSLTAVGLRGVAGAASLNGAGSLTAVGMRGALGAASLDGIATLTALPGGDQTGAASLVGIGTVTAAGAQGFVGAAALNGLGAVDAIGTRGHQGAADISGIGIFTPMSPAILAAASLAGVGAFSGDGRLGAGGKATLAGEGAVAAVGLRGVRGAALLAGIGSVVAAGSLGAAGRAALNGVGNLVAVASLVVVVRVVSRQRPRIYIHDGATLQRIAQLTRVKDINRSFSLRDRVHTGTFTIARSDQWYSLTSDHLAHVVVIESSEYPYPWVGRIVERSRAENGRAAAVVADTYEAILGERFLPPDFETRTGTEAAVRHILATANGINAMGISLGEIEAGASPPLTLSDSSPLEALDQLAELVDMEWWIGATVDRAGDLILEVNMRRERGADLSDTVRLSGPGGNFELEDWRGTNRGNAYAQTVVGGQASPIEAWSERERSRARRGEEGALPAGDVNDFVVQVQRSIRFGHLVAGETSFTAPTQRREWRQVVEALKGSGDTGEVAARALQRHRFPSRGVIGMVYPEAETWPYLEVGNMIWLSHPEPFDDGYDGPATIIDVQPIEHRRMAQVILEVE